MINMVKMLMMSAKMATPVLLKIKVIWNKGYYVIYSVYDFTNKTRIILWMWSCDQSLVTLAFVEEKLS